MIMKRIVNISQTVCALLLLMEGMSACDDAKYDVVQNRVYITQALSDESAKVTIDSENGGTAAFTVSLSDKFAQDVTVKMGASSTVLENYNRTHETNYKELPSSLYTFSNDQVVIPAGEVVSSLQEVNIKPLTQELADSGDQYAIPITVQSDDAEGVPSVSSYLLLLDQVIITSVPILDYSNHAEPVMRQDYTLGEWSIEFRINMSSFNINNQAIIGIYPDEVYVRFGDAGKDYNMLQVKTQGSQIDSNTRFDTNTWYHIAIVGNASSLRLYVDGVLDSTLPLSGSAAWSFAKDQFYLIGSGATYFRADCMLSEFRFWTKAISLSQIQNNMYVINPQTDGLEGYWKMNEGEGNTFKDATGHGNDMTAAGTVRWKDGVRSDEKK